MSHPLCSAGRVNTNHILNPDHHIWNNNGTWWCHFTVHNPDYTKERVRVSLHTKDRHEARRRRDFIMRGSAAIAGSILRSCNPAAPGAAADFGAAARGRRSLLQTAAA
jgi:hypothetical protein